MPTVWTLENAPDEPLPSGFSGPDVRFPAAFVERVLTEFTRPGDVVFDPFTGFGTTLAVAERLGRIPAGTEYDRARYEYTRGRLTETRWFYHGDARRLAEFPCPLIDFSLTSPPYMNRNDPEDPLTNYAEPLPTAGGYESYLAGLTEIYARIAGRMRPGARAAIEVANLRPSGGVTTLAWDVARAVSAALTFEGETILHWSPTYGFGYDHSYLLLFRKTAMDRPDGVNFA